MEKEKTYLPDGISEAKFVEIVNKVSLRSAIKYQFGYHDVGDLLQHSYILAITFLKEGKFKPRGEKPMEVQLTNFLRVWIHNRLNNYRRDNSCRYPNNGGSNQCKFNVMHPLHINSQGLTNSEIFARESGLPDELAQREIFEQVESGLKPRMRKLYRRYVEGEEIDEVEFERLTKAVKKVIGDESEDYI